MLLFTDYWEAASTNPFQTSVSKVLLQTTLKHILVAQAAVPAGEV